MMLLAHHLVLDAPSQSHIDHRFVERGDAINTYDIVLAQGQTSWTRRGGTQSAGVLESEELTQLRLGRFIQVDFAEVDDSVWVGCKDCATG